MAEPENHGSGESVSAIEHPTGVVVVADIVPQMTPRSERFDALREPATVAIIESHELIWVKKLGEGNYATVEEYLLHGKSVAVKRLKPDMAENTVELRGFVNEGAVIAGLNHPFIVPVVGLGFHIDVNGEERDPSTLFMAQELCSGGSLRAKVLDQMSAWNKVLYTYSEGLRWCTQMTWAVAYLHGQKPMIIHRDLKLDNVLLTDSTSTAEVKLADFGLIAQVTVDGLTNVGHELTGQTGSYLNMAPEMIVGNNRYNEKVDIFSLGCCIFEIFSKAITAAAVAVTGTDDEFKAIAMKVARGFRRDIPKHWPAALSELVTDCWSHDPTLRPTALEVVERLESPALKTLVEEWDATEKARMAGCCVVQ